MTIIDAASTAVQKTRARLKLPPSGRDFDVQWAIQCDGLSTWQAAKKFGISQMRVRQILQRVADWIAEALPPQMEAEAAARLRYAEHLASDRLQYFYCEAMEQWRTTHQTRLLMQAMRVAQAASKLAAPAGRIEAIAADAEEEGGQGTGVGGLQVPRLRTSQGMAKLRRSRRRKAMVKIV